MSESSKDRVFAAAERIAAERTPTVTAVREAAGVSMADASAYLRQWKDEAAASTAAVVAAPGALTDQAQKLAGAIWAEAVRLAGQEHRDAQTRWEAEKESLNQEVAELVAAADTTESQHRTALAAAEKARDDARSRASDAQTAARQAREDLETARTQNTELREQLAAAQATASSVQRAMDAVLARISTAEEPGTEDNQGTS